MIRTRTFREPHTLAQLARRAGISEGRARVLSGEGKLPRPDGHDADSKPLWTAATIDAWCLSTGRKPGKNAVWLYQTDDPTEAVPLLYQGMRTAQGRYGTTHQIYIQLWDTPRGHLAHVLQIDSPTGPFLGGRELAAAAAELINPAFWEAALVAVPGRWGIEHFTDHSDSPLVPPYDLYRLEAEPGTGQEPSGLRRLLGQPEPPSARPDLLVHEAGFADPQDIARVTGQPLRVWPSGTCTPTAITRAEVIPGTLTVPDDDLTPWPAALRNLDTAQDAGLPARFPAAFELLVRETHETLTDVQRLHDGLITAGPGWYLAARPAPPHVPILLDRQLAAAAPDADTDRLLIEFAELRGAEGALPTADPTGDGLAAALDAVARELHRRKAEIPNHTQPYTFATFGGPVYQLWRETLTPLQGQDLTDALASRRLRRLAGASLEDIREVLVDHAGRYTAIEPRQLPGYDPESIVYTEWPASAPVGWTDETVIAADPEHGAVGVFALIPSPDGTLRVEPVPCAGTRPSFAYGYSGGSPTTLWRALTSCATGLPLRWPDPEAPKDPSPLRAAIYTTKGPLRLRWSDVRQWAHEDKRAAGSEPDR